MSADADYRVTPAYRGTLVVASALTTISVIIFAGIYLVTLFRQREISTRQRNLVLILSATNVVLAFGMSALCWTAFYLPIFEMATVVE